MALRGLDPNRPKSVLECRDGPVSPGADLALDAVAGDAGDDALALLGAATVAFMLTCIWGGDQYAWGSAQIVALIATTVVAAAALVVRERHAADPIVPFHLLRTDAVAVASSTLFFATASLFAITVFVPLYLLTTTGATPTEAGLLLVPAMLGITVSTTLSGRRMARTGGYKAFPIAGLALMAGALGLLAALAGHPSQAATGGALAVFGLGFGMVTQILIVAVQNSVERRELGVATAVTGFFRALGGASGAAALGAVFAAGAGANVSDVGAAALRTNVIDGVQSVFIVAAPLAALALIIVLRLPEMPLKGRADQARPAGEGRVSDRGEGGATSRIAEARGNA
jgi:predicted MFS family arabinose efflux permease